MIDLLFLASGLALLVVGAEALVRGALAAARRLGVSPLLAGLVIVGFGTSTPELVVSVGAAMSGQPDIALGNVIGSNIANILLILGLSGLIMPLRVHRSSLARDGLAMLGATGLFLLLAYDGGLGAGDGVVFLMALAAYLGWSYRTERIEPQSPGAELHRAEADELVEVPASLPRALVWIVGGLAFLIGGARLFLTGAVGLGETLGVPPAIVGLTVVALGTSLPELAVSLVAALRGHADVAVGNVLGSNILNLLGILGVSSLLQPLTLAGRMLVIDQWVMLGATVLLLAFLLSGLRLNRIEAGVLLAAYGGYVASMAG